MGKYRKLTQRRNWAWWLVVPVVKPALLATTTRDWKDADKIPATGGCILALNHVSEIDPLTSSLLVWDWGRLPMFLAKAGLFKNKAFGYFMRAAGQIPVERLSSEATNAFQAAVDAINDGKLIVVYPEGSITKDPAGWPMVGKSGAARIALATGCPVIPVGQWGAQHLLPAYGKPQLKGGKKTVHVRVGDPVDLADLVAKEQEHHSPEAIREATDRIMKAIVGLVEQARGETAPAELFDPRKAGVSATGNPNAKQKR